GAYMTHHKLADKRITINTTPQEALAFVKKLATDDEFRARLAENPRDVLAEHHLDFPVEHLPSEAILPDKEVLQKALADFSEGGILDHSVRSPDRWAFGLFWWLYYTEVRPARSCIVPKAQADALKSAQAKLPHDEAKMLDKWGK